LLQTADKVDGTACDARDIVKHSCVRPHLHGQVI
jgi:hypothetical protein